MLTLINLFLTILRSCLRTNAQLRLELLALRQQLAVFKHVKPRPRLRRMDRLFWAWLSRFWAGWQDALVIVKPETVIGWHHLGFKLFWSWKSRHRGPGRPRVPKEVRDLIRTMSLANPRWGAPRIHDELAKLGIELAESTVANYMSRPRNPPSQTWRTFLDNHLKDIVAMDFFTVPTATFRVL